MTVGVRDCVVFLSGRREAFTDLRRGRYADQPVLSEKFAPFQGGNLRVDRTEENPSGRRRWPPPRGRSWSVPRRRAGARIAISPGLSALINGSTTKTTIGGRKYAALPTVEIASHRCRLLRAKQKTIALLEWGEETPFAQASSLLQKIREAGERTNITARTISVDAMVIGWDRGEVADRLGCLKASEQHEPQAGQTPALTHPVKALQTGLSRGRMRGELRRSRARPAAQTMGLKKPKIIIDKYIRHIHRSCEEAIPKLGGLDPKTQEAHNITGPQIYTDGSKIEGKVGAAVTWWENGEESKYSTFGLEPHNTVFQSEMYALFRAVKMARESRVASVSILSDSRSSLDLLRSPSGTSSDQHSVGYQRHAHPAVSGGCRTRYTRPKTARSCSVHEQRNRKTGHKLLCGLKSSMSSRPHFTRPRRPDQREHHQGEHERQQVRCPATSVRFKGKTVALLEWSEETPFAQANRLLQKIGEAEELAPRTISVDAMAVGWERGDVADRYGCLKASEHHEVIVYEDRGETLSYLRTPRDPTTTGGMSPATGPTIPSGSERAQQKAAAEKAAKEQAKTTSPENRAQQKSRLKAIGNFLNALLPSTSHNSSTTKQESALKRFFKKSREEPKKPAPVPTRADKGHVSPPTLAVNSGVTDMWSVTPDGTEGLLGVLLKEAGAAVYDNATSQVIAGEMTGSYMAAYSATSGFVALDQEESERTGTARFKTPKGDSIVVTAKCTRIMLEDRILEMAQAISGTAEPPALQGSWAVPKIQWVNGVPGCGKTTWVVSHFNEEEDMVATTTTEAAKDLREKLAHRLGQRARTRVRTMASILSNGFRPHDKCHRIIVDEALMNHFGAIVMAARLSGASEVVLVGDVNQLPFLDRENLFQLNYTRPNVVAAITHELSCTHRNPMDVAYTLGEIYPGIYSSRTTQSRVHSLRSAESVRASSLARGSEVSDLVLDTARAFASGPSDRGRGSSPSPSPLDPFMGGGRWRYPPFFCARKIQDAILDTVTNIYNGKLDFHLISPKQLRTELSSIAAHIPKDTALPVNHLNLKDLYNLIKVRAKYYIPRILNHDMIHMKVISSFAAINLRKDSYVTFAEAELQSYYYLKNKYYYF
ncbi:hypothetical protein HW555_006753 [Spodoptera exigua]|uniref:(+)RNA virus helicase C-terminal domain-containing protein n=1 Tax=Spodoptera exigua TaxID=7107 RepID=A0A835L616_SPOEX|nr:hypothetical protein HW555_006753 [Spodoptera exigua]